MFQRSSSDQAIGNVKGMTGHLPLCPTRPSVARWDE